MGWLKKHLNPNPVKQIKTSISDTKKSIKMPMQMMSGKKSSSSAAASTKTSSPINTSKLPSYKQKQLGLLPGQTPRAGQVRQKATVGQGNAPAPKKITSSQIKKPAAPIPPVKALRKSSARTSLNSMGTPGRNRFK